MTIRERFEALQPRERIAVFVFGAIALIAIVYAVFAFGGGGAAPITVPSTLPSVVVNPTQTASPLPVFTEAAGGKDPFLPLVGAGGTGGAGGGSPAPQPTGTSGSGTSGSSSSSSSSSKIRVTLLKVFTRNGTRFATVEVNGTDYTVRPGQTFDSNFQLLSLSSSCGQFAYGDSRFTLCAGEQIMK